jgi:hypothetical protein
MFETMDGRNCCWWKNSLTDPRTAEPLMKNIKRLNLENDPTSKKHEFLHVYINKHRYNKIIKNNNNNNK